MPPSFHFTDRRAETGPDVQILLPPFSIQGLNHGETIFTSMNKNAEPGAGKPRPGNTLGVLSEHPQSKTIRRRRRIFRGML